MILKHTQLILLKKKEKDNKQTPDNLKKFTMNLTQRSKFTSDLLNNKKLEETNKLIIKDYDVSHLLDLKVSTKKDHDKLFMEVFVNQENENEFGLPLDLQTLENMLMTTYKIDNDYKNVYKNILPNSLNDNILSSNLKQNEKDQINKINTINGLLQTKITNLFSFRSQENQELINHYSSEPHKKLDDFKEELKVKIQNKGDNQDIQKDDILIKQNYVEHNHID